MSPTDPSGTRLTVGEIVRRWDQSPTTVRRHMAAGTLRGAGQVGRGFWSAPIESVLAQYGPEPVHEDSPEIIELRAVVAVANSDRAAALHRVEVLEAVAAGQAETIEALRLALSMRAALDDADRVDAASAL
jgi:hypothetical protein